MEFKDIQRVNATLRTVDIKGKDYVEVNKRVMAFRELEPNGTITTEIVDIKEDKNGGGIVTMKATVCDGEGRLLATGTAQEKESSSYINKTSYIENCETSAVGRALGFIGIGTDTSIASAEEVLNAITNQGKSTGNAGTEDNTEDKKLTYRERVIITAQERGISFNKLAKDYNLNGKTTEARFKEVLEDLEGK